MHPVEASTAPLHIASLWKRQKPPEMNQTAFEVSVTIGAPNETIGCEWSRTICLQVMSLTSNRFSAQRHCRFIQCPDRNWFLTPKAGHKNSGWTRPRQLRFLRNESLIPSNSSVTILARHYAQCCICPETISALRSVLALQPS